VKSFEGQIPSMYRIIVKFKIVRTDFYLNIHGKTIFLGCANFWEEGTASIFRVEEKAEHATICIKLLCFRISSIVLFFFLGTRD
jgi:hypothetical protein